MISLLQARTLALASVTPGRMARVPLLEAHGRFLAEAIRADRPAPPCDNSAMDGFAVQVNDIRGARRDRPVVLRVVGTLFAGAPVPSRDLAPGEAYRIFTGAPVPWGADAVIRQEATRDDGQSVAILVPAESGENIRRRGEEYAEGALLFDVGQRADAHALAVLASLGRHLVPVREQPRVAILTVGDELVPPGAPAQPHQIYDSNGTLLAALSVEAGARVVAAEHAPDRDDALREAVGRLLDSADLLITSGGASVGQRDRVKQVLASMGGTLGFDGVALKPGKPASVGMVGRKPISILPGNPGAATVGFDQLTRPMLLKLQGVLEVRRRVRAKIDSARKKQPGLTYLVGARLERKDGETWARLRTAGAGQLYQNVGIEGWAVLPAGQGELAAGDEVEVELLEGAAYRPVPPGDASAEATR